MQRAPSSIGSSWKGVSSGRKATAAIALVAAVVIACYDASAPVEVTQRTGTVFESKTPGPRKTHRVNRMAHVGELHNRMLDAYRNDLRRQSRVYGRPCTGAGDWFATAPAAAAVRVGLSEDQILEVVGKNASRVRPCSVVQDRLEQARKRAKSKIIQAAYSSPMEEGDVPISDSAAVLLTQIQTAVGQLTTADALDDLLDPIIAAADGLGSSDADAVLSYAAVASSSGHYWEANHATAALALLPVSAGGACEVDCPTEGQWETNGSPFTPRRTPMHAARRGPGSAQGQACLIELITQTGGWSDVARADVWGVIAAVVVDKKWNPRSIAIATGLASGSQLSWHQLLLVGCYIFAM